MGKQNTMANIVIGMAVTSIIIGAVVTVVTFFLTDDLVDEISQWEFKELEEARVLAFERKVAFERALAIKRERARAIERNRKRAIERDKEWEGSFERVRAIERDARAYDRELARSIELARAMEREDDPEKWKEMLEEMIELNN